MSEADCAVPESAPDVVAYLMAQHQQITAMLEATLDAEGEQRRETFLQFRRFLAVHEASEQEIVHPRAAHELADGGRVVSARLDEEQEIDRAIGSIETQDMCAVEFDTSIRTLLTQLLGHLRLEEELEFADLRVQLGTRQRRRLSNAVRLAAAPSDLAAVQGATFRDMLAFSCTAICEIDDDDN
jgi:hypothetical protein